MGDCHVFLCAGYKLDTDISVVAFTPGMTPSISETTVLPAGKGPTWIAHHPLGHPVVLVVDGNELRTYEYKLEGSTIVRWVLLSACAPRSWGRIVHGSWSNDANYILAVDYDAGCVGSFHVENGRIIRQAAQVTFNGSGAYAPLQSSSHPHEVIQHPDSRVLYVCDMGMDTVHVLGLAQDGGLRQVQSFAVDGGSGPRHAVLHPTGRTLYVLGEISCNIIALSVEENGQLSGVGNRVSILPDAMPMNAGHNLPSGERGMMAGEIVVSSDGTRLYASNRNQQMVASDQIACFTLESEFPFALMVSSRVMVDSVGALPRGMVLSPDNVHLAVCNQNSNSVAVFDTTKSKPVIVASTGLPSRIHPTGVIWLAGF